MLAWRIVHGLLSVFLGAACCSPVPPPVSAPPLIPRPSATSDVRGPETAAEEWLRLNDTENFAASWAECAPGLKEMARDRATFEKALRASRPVGTVTSRTQTSLKRMTALPGRPAGQYSRAVFETVFSEDGTAVEQVLMAKDSDGRWRVLGSRIQLANPAE